MRPILTDSASANYSKDFEIKKKRANEFMKTPDEGSPAKKRKPIVEEVPIESVQDELEALLAAHAAQNHQWDSDENRINAEQLQDAMGHGYLDATQSLINQTGQYCAYCDAPVFSDLQANPVLPAAWFPSQTFDFETMLLICPACREIKEKADNRLVPALTDAQEYLSYYAWPTVFWKNLGDRSLLPFRYDLVRQPMMTPFTRDDLRVLLYYYRLGHVYVERSDPDNLGKVFVNVPEAEPIWISVQLSKTSIGNAAIESGINHLLESLRLNDLISNIDTLDRRLELRTLAYFKALDFRERINNALRLGDATLVNSLSAVWRDTVRATGFWGVWLSVFKDEADIQPRLAEVFPGTANKLWTVL